MTITLDAPAKVNLFLNVIARRADGYHDIETCFEKIALFDTLTFKKSTSNIKMRSNSASLPLDENNLIFKAVRLVEKRLRRKLGVEIEIEKKIPIGAGLGGGSSDAATALIGIDMLYDLKLAEEFFMEAAIELGADVPFFLSKSSWAIGRKRGDEIENVQTHLKLWHILIVPDFSVSSRDAYEWSDKKDMTHKPKGIEMVLSGIESGDTERIGKYIQNDLEGLSFERDGVLREQKELLIKYGAKGSAISGSGPVLFGIVDNKEEVMDLAGRIKEKLATKRNSWDVLVVPTLGSK